MQEIYNWNKSKITQLLTTIWIKESREKLFPETH